GDPFLVRLAGYGNLVMLSAPEAVRDVFRGDAQVLHSGEGNEFLSVTVGTNSVLVLDDDAHARQRRILLPPLKGERMRSFFGAMQAATLEAVHAWPLGRPVRMVEPMRAPWRRFVWSCRESPDPAGRKRVKRSVYLHPKGARGQQHAVEAT